MQLEHEFTVPVPPEEAWQVLLDVERVAPCMPGATLESFTGDEFTGKVKVKVGPITVTYSGQGTFVDKDESAKTVTIEAAGKEVKGQGTAKATVTAHLEDQDGQTKATVTTDLNVTGRPAQFGRGVMADVGGKLIGRFSSCLAEQLAGSSDAAAPASSAASSSTGTSATGSTPSGGGNGSRSGGSRSGTSSAGSSSGGSSSAAVPQPSPAPTSERRAASADEGAAGGADAASSAGASTGAGAQPPRLQAPRESEPIDLLETAGLPVLKRVLPLAGALVLLAAVVWWWRRR